MKTLWSNARAVMTLAGAIAVTVWCVVWSVAAPPATAPSAEVPKLIAQLSDADWRVREKAMSRLVELGDEARPALEKLAKGEATPDARALAGKALKLIGETGLTGESLVTLHFKNAHPRDVIADLARQGHTELPVWPPNAWEEPHRKWPMLTIDTDRQPFWAVLRDVCEKAGLGVQTFGSGDRLSLSPHGGDGRWDGVTHMNGPFMFVARSASETQSKNVPFGKKGAPSTAHVLMVSVTAFAEPKLRVLGRSHAPELSEATDDAGRSLKTGDAPFHEGLDTNLHGNPNVWDMNVMLKPTPGAKRLAKLKGTSKLLVQTKSETLELPDPLKAKDLVKVVAGRKFVFKDMKQQGGGYSLSVTIHSPPGEGPEWQRRADPQNLRVFDASGRAFSRTGYSGSGSADRYDYEIRLTPEGPRGEQPGEPAKLTWELTTEAREIDATFEFKDLPLP